MKYNDYLEQYKPLAVFQVGSKLFNLQTDKSDIDLIFYIGDKELPKTIKDKEEKLDIFFLNDKLELSYLQNNKKYISANLIGKLQLFFLDIKNVLYSTNNEVLNSLKNKIKEHKKQWLYDFINTNIEVISFNTKLVKFKSNYHFCYIASLIDDIEPKWDIIKRIKNYQATEQDFSYLDYQKDKLKKYWIKIKYENN